MEITTDFSFYPRQRVSNINIMVMIDIRRKSCMGLHFGMPWTVYSYIMKPLLVIIFQIEINQVLNGSTLYGRDRKHSTGQYG